MTEIVERALCVSKKVSSAGAQCEVDKITSQAISGLLDGSATALGFLDRLNNAPKRRFSSDFLYRYLKRSRLIHRSGVNRTALCLLLWKRFPCNGCLFDSRASGHHLAFYRDSGTWSYQHSVAVVNYPNR